LGPPIAIRRPLDGPPWTIPVEDPQATSRPSAPSRRRGGVVAPDPVSEKKKKENAKRRAKMVAKR